MIDLILADLKSRFGAKVLLDPDDLVEVIGISTGQQANLRSQGRFPIATQKIGNRVKISIYELAKYLAGLATAHAKDELAKIPTPLPRAEKKARKGLLEKGWWAFRHKAVVSIIEKSLLHYELNLHPAPIHKFTKTNP